MEIITLGERIKALMLEKNIKSLNEFHSLLVKRYGEKALSRRSLTTIINKRIVLRNNTIKQICEILECTPRELMKETTARFREEEHIKIILSKEESHFQYYLSRGMPFSVEKLHLRKGAEIPMRLKKETADPKICIYVTRGKMETYQKNLKGDPIVIKAGKSVSIITTKNVYLRNSSNQPSCAILIAYPSREKYYLKTGEEN